MLTEHAYDRHERFFKIAKYIGWGDVVFRWVDKSRNNIVEVTSTGVVRVLTEDGQIVTAYPASMNKIVYIMHRCGKERMPQDLYGKIIKNKRIINQYFGGKEK